MNHNTRRMINRNSRKIVDWDSGRVNHNSRRMINRNSRGIDDWNSGRVNARGIAAYTGCTTITVLIQINQLV
jgi:hypothetical protein